MGNTASHTHEPLERGYARDAYGDIKNTRFASFRFSKRTSPNKMDRLRRSFRDSFRRRKDRVPESSKPPQWPTDEQAVRSSTCSFPVKYLGCVEVFESRGMHICEEAIKVLRSTRRRPVRGLLHVSGDGLRVVDDDTKGLIVDQTIEKVSFCAPDRNHERGFSYICRDGTTRRWMCHGFLANKDSGERLSHAVGCAFTVCLERKQRRDTECAVTMTFDTKTSAFTRNGSFRQPTLTERLHHNERGIDIGRRYEPPAAIVPPQPKPHNPYAIDRPHATPSMLERQGSFRGFTSLNSQSPFKRQMSLRLNELPSTAERQKSFLDPITTNGHTVRSVSPIPEVAVADTKPTTQTTTIEQQPPELDMVSAFCKELSQGLSMLTRNDNGDELNFNLQTVTSSTPIEQLKNTSDYVMPGAVSTDHIKKFTSAISPIDTPAKPIATVAGQPVTTNSDYIPMVASTTNPISNPLERTPQRHRASISGALPSSISQQLHSLADDSKSNEFTTVYQPQKLSQIVAPNNQLPNAEQWLGQVVKNVSPAASKRPPPLHARAKSLNTDPFDAEWVANVTTKIDEVTKKPVKTEQPVIKHTNPFRPPLRQLDF